MISVTRLWRARQRSHRDRTAQKTNDKTLPLTCAPHHSADSIPIAMIGHCIFVIDLILHTLHSHFHYLYNAELHISPPDIPKRIDICTQFLCHLFCLRYADMPRCATSILLIQKMMYTAAVNPSAHFPYGCIPVFIMHKDRRGENDLAVRIKFHQFFNKRPAFAKRGGGVWVWNYHAAVFRPVIFNTDPKIFTKRIGFVRNSKQFAPNGVKTVCDIGVGDRYIAVKKSLK